ncbi:MAG: efflux RND transporter permease subunit [Chthoniobacterales bacterium]|nr:efflux RND transporter permease subunit [Chthoniobacterales bacterium]
MIEKLIDWCVRNRVMVLLLCGFLIAGGWYSAKNITVDAIPDLSDVQVVIRTEYAGQAPRIVEDQVTYPLTTAMLAVPYAKVVRGYSMFGTSFVYVIFEDGTDIYWARSRVLEQLNSVSNRLPSGVAPQLGPDATGVGWIFQYVLTTGPYCAEHPGGLWHDPETGRYYTSPAEASDADRERLVLQRTFPGMEKCPLDGTPLIHPDIDLADLRSLQDWYLRYELTAVEGVSEVAPVGGFVKQYQVVVDPVQLRAYDIPLQKVRMAIQRSNLDVGGRLIEQSETEYMVRGLGYLGTLNPEETAAASESGRRIEDVRSEKALEELRSIALGVNESGAPIRLADVAEVRLGPDIRRGIAEWNGEGEVVGGTIVMRFGENAKRTIENVREKLATLEAGLPPGVAIDIAYDRSDLIERAVETLRHTLTEEVLVVAFVCILFLLHARSALVAAFVLPTGVLATLTVMHLLGINANIMSLGGIAISIGVMVDSSIIMVENAHKFLEIERHRVAAGAAPRPRTEIIADAAKEVGPSLFFALLIIVVSFLPIFVLGEQSGRLFKPLAFTKTFAMGAGALLAVTVIPVLMTLFVTERTLPAGWTRRRRLATYLGIIIIPAILLFMLPLPGVEISRWLLAGGWAVLSSLILLPQRIPDEDRNPISRVLEAIYNPAFSLVMRFKWLTLLVAVALLAATWYPLSRLGSEFMPPLEEGDLLYMPTTDPGIGVTKAKEILQQTDKLLTKFPEVQSVFGKIGRAETATDPAPISMLETTITLHRDKSKWRRVRVPRFYDSWPQWARWFPEKLWPSTRPLTTDEIIYGYEIPDGNGGHLHVPGMNDAVQIPGLTNAWTMPIRTRIDMLSTGIRTPIGIKFMGSDLATLADLANEAANALKTDPLTAPYTTSAFPEKSVGGNYFDIEIDREAISRYGLLVGDVQDVIMTALGGMTVTSTVEGLERYPVNVRYPSELRDTIEAVRQTLVATPSGAQVPLAQLAEITIRKGPPMVKSENARLTSWVYVDIANIDVGTYVEQAKEVVARAVPMPPGTTVVWSGQYEYMQKASERLRIAIPLALVGIILLLYLSTRSWLRVSIILLAVPFSLIGAIWFLYLMEYNLSLAVWVGLIALAGLDAETGAVMLLYLDTSFNRFRSEGRLNNREDLWHAVHDGAVKRIRPKTMTVMSTFVGLLPLLWAEGAGADTMRRLAVPMIGGLASSFLLELLIYPVIYYLARQRAVDSLPSRNLICSN